MEFQGLQFTRYGMGRHGLMFDWVRFLEEYSIEYVTSGPNVAKGNLAIRCPFCGFDDPSHHMGISLKGKGWGCWRRTDHRGKSPVRLIVALLSCSVERARGIVGADSFIPQNFEDKVRSHLEAEPFFVPGLLEMPKEFRSLTSLPSARLFIDYLRRRGFDDSCIEGMTKRYGIYYCTRGAFKGRIIFPVYYQDKLVSWVGRTIYPVEKIRYKALTVDPDKVEFDGLSQAVGPIGDYLLWYDTLPRSGSDILIVGEGPFDALKVAVLGANDGIDSTCLFGQRLSRSQINLFHDLLPMYSSSYILLDRGALPSSLRLVSQLSALNISVLQLPFGIDDPAELTKAQLLKIILDYRKKR